MTGQRLFTITMQPPAYVVPVYASSPRDALLRVTEAAARLGFYRPSQRHATSGESEPGDGPGDDTRDGVAFDVVGQCEACGEWLLDIWEGESDGPRQEPAYASDSEGVMCCEACWLKHEEG